MTESVDLSPQHVELTLTGRLKRFVQNNFLLLLLVFGLAVYIVFEIPERIGTAINFTIDGFMGVMPIFVIALFLAGLIDEWLDRDWVTSFIADVSLVRGLLTASLVGFFTPGPIVGIFPLVLMMSRKGVPPHFLMAFMVSQILMGTIRIPLEIEYLGFDFWIFRSVVSVMLGIVAGLMTLPFSRYIDEELTGF